MLPVDAGDVGDTCVLPDNRSACATTLPGELLTQPVNVRLESESPEFARGLWDVGPNGCRNPGNPNLTIFP